MATTKTFKELVVWQEGHKLVLMIYAETRKFPKSELFALTSQLRRAAVSVTSNIAEGYGRQSVKDKEHFYIMARGSLDEVSNQIQIAFDLNYMEYGSFIDTEGQINTVAKLPSGLLRAHRNF
jgi:four helix bundle protein